MKTCALLRVVFTYSLHIPAIVLLLTLKAKLKTVSWRAQLGSPCDIVVDQKGDEKPAQLMTAQLWSPPL